MRDNDHLLLEKIWLKLNESISRVSQSEVKFYFDEIFGNSASDLVFMKPSNETDWVHPKFDKIIFEFNYKSIYTVKVFSSPGEDAGKSDSGSVSASVFIGKIKDNTGYTKKQTNSFYNELSKKVNYDPIIKNGKDLLLYVKSVLDQDDRDKDIETIPIPSTPKAKSNPVLAV